MVTIIYEAHGTTLDNEAGLSSGWYDVELSELGRKQAKELGERYKATGFDAVFCSDLRRSLETARIAFAGRDIKIIKDRRLRECNYGELNRHLDEQVVPFRQGYLTKPFPNGESYKQANERVRSFLVDLLKNYDGKKVLIIDHRVTQYALEHFINKIPLEEAVIAPWQWQPGWTYYLEKI